MAGFARSPMGPLLNRPHDVERAQQKKPIYAFDIVGPPHLPDPARSIPSQSLPERNYDFLAIVYRGD
jgi:hypothetical protein